MGHPFVSEEHEGKPWFEWAVAVVVVVAAIIAAFGYIMAATLVLGVTAMITGLVRAVMREHSPWKIRSVAFDTVCGIGFGIVLFALGLSIRLLTV
ncbi:DUF3017 domain-containing protein [Bifidobacterium gallicum]|uniref:Rod shape-determining protein RodA n=2 Tax=Bifidobacterium gallicum TaxID=78342 RepID=A0A087AJ01_9BIFI|nr:rod shape-determining protein RodA [Bifidobacterium gallicum DSM 20093 = LMG 11596]